MIKYPVEEDDSRGIHRQYTRLYVELGGFVEACRMMNINPAIELMEAGFLASDIAPEFRGFMWEDKS